MSLILSLEKLEIFKMIQSFSELSWKHLFLVDCQNLNFAPLESYGLQSIPLEPSTFRCNNMIMHV